MAAPLSVKPVRKRITPRTWEREQNSLLRRIPAACMNVSRIISKERRWSRLSEERAVSFAVTYARSGLPKILDHPPRSDVRNEAYWVT